MFKKILMGLGLSLSVVGMGALPSGAEEAVPKIGTESGRVFLMAGPGLSFLKGSTGWATNVGVLTPVQDGSPLFVGADLALNFWGSSPTIGSLSQKSSAIQILPSAIYRFQYFEANNVYPYLGASVGPNFFRTTTTNGANEDTRSQTYLQVMVRPGVFTHLTKTIALNIEGKLGLIGTDFAFQPQALAVISL